MATYSFSTSGNFWKTKYSFEPDCYGSTDNYFLSMKPIQPIIPGYGNARFCWLHNSNQSRNKFYEQSFPSRFSVVSNQDPSMEKVYKAISIESNQNVFEAVLYTNLDLSASSVTKPQQTDKRSFSAREEGLYASVGPSLINSTRNFGVIGRISGVPIPLNSSGLSQNKFIKTIESGYAYKAFKIQIVGNSSSVNESSKYKAAFSTFSPSAGMSLPKFISYSGNTVLENEFSVGECYSRSSYHIAAIRSNVNVAYPDTYIVIGYRASQQNDLSNPATNSLRGFDTGNIIYYVSNPAIDGDDIRGKYSMIAVETKQNMYNTPFELFAVNAEFAQSKLDASS